MADDHTTSPVSDAMVLKIMAERERYLGFTAYADWLNAGCPDKGADDQWEYPQEKIDDVRFYIVAMKAKEEAADPIDGEVKDILGNWRSFKGHAADQAQPLISDDGAGVIKGSDQTPADEVERQRRMSLLDARKSLVTGDDGYVIFWPTSNVGAYTSYDLREIADELDKRNASWDAIIQSDPRISGAAIRNTPQTDDPEEAFQIGLRDGYEKAVQDIDLMTGGDGEYRYCVGGHGPERHCPDADTMKARIVARCTPQAIEATPSSDGESEK